MLMHKVYLQRLINAAAPEGWCKSWCNRRSSVCGAQVQIHRRASCTMYIYMYTYRPTPVNICAAPDCDRFRLHRLRRRPLTTLIQHPTDTLFYLWRKRCCCWLCAKLTGALQMAARKLMSLSTPQLANLADPRCYTGDPDLGRRGHWNRFYYTMIRCFMNFLHFFIHKLSISIRI